MSALPRIPIARPDITDLERENVRQVMESGWISQGEWVEKAEAKLCEITGRKYAICTSSGTTALQVAILALQDRFRWITTNGRTTDTYIAVPTLTFAAVFNAVELAHCTPVYLGVDKETWQSPMSEWWRVLRKVDCFIAAPCYGMLGPMDAIEELAKNSKLSMIEDCSESFTGSVNNRKAGSWGDISICSFYANKVITAGEGGCIFTDSEELAVACRQIINHGVKGKGSYQRVRTGINGRMNDLTGAVLCAQLERLPEMWNRRQRIVSAYLIAATDKKGWTVPICAPSETAAPWLWAGVPLPRKLINDSLAVTAGKLNIETRPVFPVGHNNWEGNLLLAEAYNISVAGVVLPLSSAMTDEEVERVCTLIHSV